MGLDIRIPLGMIFAVLGLILVGYGTATNGSNLYVQTMGVNLNLIWGSVMLLFGVVMFLLARRHR